jgi:hypothetical protein
MSNPSGLIDEMIAKTPDWRGTAFASLRGIVHEADPDIVEEVKWRRPSNPMGAPVFEHAGIVCTGAFLKGRVRLTFASGAELQDPAGLFNAALEGNKMRAIDFYEGDRVDAAALKALVRAGVEHNLAKAKPSRNR